MPGTHTVMERLAAAVEALKEERDDAEAALEEAVQEQAVLLATAARFRRERDEARRVAQEFAARWIGTGWAFEETTLRNYPWLKKEPGG